ncbi:lysM and putative peptidoglycan-binding domain-containing protein 3 [Brachyhypopomus gauderio]|uniref:lysM and putative peptidoglycan-binding domain-containing protein 3 n=1 Tax=Brachyhypopomus gauderio TaxID=698409 RepID=UPI004042628F
MTGRNQYNGFQSPTTVQPAKGGQAYIFGNTSETEFSEEDGESYELRSRGRERLRRSVSRERMDDIVYVMRDIKEGDTLISISLQYFCTVADIKRANNLLTEQDFFALRSIKIPVRRFSSFTETHSTASHKTGSPGGFRRVPGNPSSGASADSSPSSSSSADSVEFFLQEKDKDIELLVKSSNPSRNSLNEVVSSLSSQQPLLGESERRPATRKDPYYGADWGMRWWTAVVIMLVVGIITPVFYLLYYEVLMKADVSHHATVETIRAEATQSAIGAARAVLPAKAAPPQQIHPMAEHGVPALRQEQKT